MKGIKNKNILVTGASSGIGAKIAEILLNNGANVGIHYNSNSKGAINTSKLSDSDKYTLFKCDIREENNCVKLIKDFIREYKTIDVLINNAGANKNKNYLELNENDWMEGLRVNLFGPYYLAREAFKYMKENKGGKIINISSIGIKYGGSDNSMHYAASKSSMEVVVEKLSREGAKYNIMINNIRPGFIDTPWHIKSERGKEDINRRIKLIKLGRIGKPIDIASMAMYLASDYGDFITGSTFTISGGD